MSVAADRRHALSVMAGWYLPSSVKDIVQTVAVVGGLYAMGLREKKLVTVATLSLGTLAAINLYLDSREP